MNCSVGIGHVTWKYLTHVWVLMLLYWANQKKQQDKHICLLNHSKFSSCAMAYVLLHFGVLLLTKNQNITYCIFYASLFGAHVFPYTKTVIITLMQIDRERSFVLFGHCLEKKLAYFWTWELYWFTFLISHCMKLLLPYQPSSQPELY